MTTPAQAPAFSDLTRRYINRHRIALESTFNSLLFLLKNPFTSRLGGRALRKFVTQEAPARWTRDFQNKRVLIVGSGPSLDRVQPEFFEGFDTFIYINFAVRRSFIRDTDYFFTTDLGPIREYLDTYDEAVFQSLGQERCIFAPIFLDQVLMLTAEGRGLFSMLCCDRARWISQKVTVGRTKLPLLLRFHPAQPQWDNFQLPSPGRKLPVLDHSSALTAILFAISAGSREIGMIGCDFSAGRAASAQSSQDIPDGNVFAGAPAVLREMQAALARHAIEVTNHSWLV